MHEQSPRGAETDRFLERVRSGRAREGVERLARAFGPDVFRYVASLTRDEHAAEDITQEAFLAASRGAERFEGASRLKTWLFGIARHVALNWLERERPRTAAGSGIEPADERRDPAPSPDEGAQSRDLASRAWSLIAGLPPVERDILTLFYQQHLSSDEIARVTGKSRGAIRVAHHRALSRLRELLPPSE